MTMFARGLANARTLPLGLATIVIRLALSACANSTANRRSPEMARHLGKDFNPGVGCDLGMTPIVEVESAWCGHRDIADLMAGTMQMEIDRSMCISDQEKREAQEWLTAFASTLHKGLRRYVDSNGRLPDRPPWPDTPDTPSPLCKNFKGEEIQESQRTLAQDLANSDRIGQVEACHPVPGP